MKNGWNGAEMSYFFFLDRLCDTYRIELGNKNDACSCCEVGQEGYVRRAGVEERASLQGNALRLDGSVRHHVHGGPHPGAMRQDCTLGLTRRPAGVKDRTL